MSISNNCSKERQLAENSLNLWATVRGFLISERLKVIKITMLYGESSFSGPSLLQNNFKNKCVTVGSTCYVIIWLWNYKPLKQVYFQIPSEKQYHKILLRAWVRENARCGVFEFGQNDGPQGHRVQLQHPWHWMK